MQSVILPCLLLSSLASAWVQDPPSAPAALIPPRPSTAAHDQGGGERLELDLSTFEQGREGSALQPLSASGLSLGQRVSWREFDARVRRGARLRKPARLISLDALPLHQPQLEAEHLEAGQSSGEGDEGIHLVTQGAAAGIGLRWRKFTASLGYELLEGSSRPGPTGARPLGLLRELNEEAGELLSPPDTGIEDRFLALGWQGEGGLGIQAVYHDFTPWSGEGDYGSELDVVGTWSVSERLQLGVKYATSGMDALEESDGIFGFARYSLRLKN